jgi:hypothetical protein
MNGFNQNIFLFWKDSPSKKLYNGFMRTMMPSAAGILLLLAMLISMALPGPAHAQQPAAQLSPYPAGVKNRYVDDCMRQQMPSAKIMEMLGRKVSQRQMYGYCLCLFNYVQGTVPYAQYQDIDNLTRQGMAGMQKVRANYPWFFPTFQKGVEQCGAFLHNGN